MDQGLFKRDYAQTTGVEFKDCIWVLINYAPAVKKGKFRLRAGIKISLRRNKLGMIIGGVKDPSKPAKALAVKLYCERGSTAEKISLRREIVLYNEAFPWDITTEALTTLFHQKIPKSLKEFDEYGNYSLTFIDLSWATW